MKYLILGGGPSGLSFACKLKEHGEDSFLVLEKEAVAGGLCRSVKFDESYIDIGGGHFLDVSRPKVNDFLFSFMPKSQWNLFERNSCIKINNTIVSHPIEANIWQMNLSDQVEYLKSIAVAGCNLEKPMPEEFVEWIYWKLGNKIAKDYMIPYNQKIFGQELNQLGTYWLEKLPNVSIDETFLSCLTKKAYGKQPGHEKFYYPKEYGYGELWIRLAESIRENIIYNCEINAIDFKTKTVTNCNGEKYSADVIISTIPWRVFKEIIGMPNEIKERISILKHTSIKIDYYSEIINTKAHWIYYPNLDLSYHRALFQSNFAKNGKGYWTETNTERTINKNTVSDYENNNEYAYPLNTKEKPKAITKLMDWAKSKNVYGLGRWGEHQHYNSDVAVEKAIDLADYFLTNNY